MCGRFALAASPEQLARQFELPLPLPQLRPRYNIAPTQPVPVIRTDATPEHRLELGITQWGLIPEWASDPSIGHRTINARAETVHAKPSFKAAFRRRRCLIPAQGFFEWRTNSRRQKQPYFIRPRADYPQPPLFAFAGLWEVWFSQDGSEIQSSSIITTEANSLMQELHHRMPVILRPEQYAGWLDWTNARPARLQKFLQPYPSEAMEYYPVDHRLVNSPRNDSPECLTAAAPADFMAETGDLFGNMPDD